MRSENSELGLTFLEEARRRQIIDCTIDVLAEDGYSRTTLARIAQRAKVSKSVIVYHFGTKDEVLLAVAEEVFTRATEAVGPRVAAETTASGKLRTYLQARVAFLATQRAHMLALIEIWMNLRDEHGQLRFGEADAVDTVDAIEQILRAGQKSHEFGSFDPAVMSMAVRQAVDGVLLQLRAHPDLDLDHYAKELVALFERATAATSRTTTPITSSTRKGRR